MIKTFLNPKGHQNRICGSKVTAILLKGRILPIGGASAVEGLRSTGLPRLVFTFFFHTTFLNFSIQPLHTICSPNISTHFFIKTFHQFFPTNLALNFSTQFFNTFSIICHIFSMFAILWPWRSTGIPLYRDVCMANGWRTFWVSPMENVLARENKSFYQFSESFSKMLITVVSMGS